MFKSILLCTDGSTMANVAGEYAIWLARKLPARIQALYITDIRLLEGPFITDISGALGAQPYTALLPQLKQLQRDKADTVLSEVARRCEKASVSCTVAHETGSLVQCLLEHERHADLLVLGQRGEHAQWLGDMLGSSVERMVRASVKPCLVSPETFREVNHLLIAYDGSAESTKALHAGIRLAGDLHALITIATVCQREHEEAASRNLRRAQDQARESKLNAEAQLLHGNPEDELLRFADKINADLIVMGAYGHTRIREFILGSTTSHVMRKAKIPVLLTRS